MIETLLFSSKVMITVNDFDSVVAFAEDLELTPPNKKTQIP